MIGSGVTNPNDNNTYEFDENYKGKVDFCYKHIKKCVGNRIRHFLQTGHRLYRKDFRQYWSLNDVFNLVCMGQTMNRMAYKNNHFQHDNFDTIVNSLFLKPCNFLLLVNRREKAEMSLNDFKYELIDGLIHNYGAIDDGGGLTSSSLNIRPTGKEVAPQIDCNTHLRTLSSRVRVCNDIACHASSVRETDSELGPELEFLTTLLDRETDIFAKNTLGYLIQHDLLSSDHLCNQRIQCESLHQKVYTLSGVLVIDNNVSVLTLLLDVFEFLALITMRCVKIEIEGTYTEVRVKYFLSEDYLLVYTSMETELSDYDPSLMLAKNFYRDLMSLNELVADKADKFIRLTEQGMKVDNIELARTFIKNGITLSSLLKYNNYDTMRTDQSNGIINDYVLTSRSQSLLTILRTFEVLLKNTNLEKALLAKYTNLVSLLDDTKSISTLKSKILRTICQSFIMGDNNSLDKSNFEMRKYYEELKAIYDSLLDVCSKFFGCKNDFREVFENLKHQFSIVNNSEIFIKATTPLVLSKIHRFSKKDLVGLTIFQLYKAVNELLRVEDKNKNDTYSNAIRIIEDQLNHNVLMHNCMVMEYQKDILQVIIGKLHALR